MECMQAKAIVALMRELCQNNILWERTVFVAAPVPSKATETGH